MTSKTKAKATKKTDYKAQAAEYLDGWQRARAELDNFRKQTAQQAATTRQQAISEVITAFLPLQDNFQAVVEHMPSTLSEDTWAAGVAHVARQFAAELAALGVEEDRPLNQQFNPARHEAIERIKKTKAKPNTIIEVVQSGYVMGEQVLRPAKVKIAA